MNKSLCRLALAALLLSSVAVAAASEEGQPVERPRVEIATSMGTIVVELYPDKAPESVDNFLSYVRRGFYDGTIFHRVIRGFMIQGGGFDADLRLRPPAGMVTNEADNGLSNRRGTLAMARRGDPHSATSQFYINHADNPGLDHRSKADGRSWGYTVFGEVVAGMDVVDAIAGVVTGPGLNRMQNVPREPVVIEGAIWVNAPPEQEPTVSLD